MARAVAALLAIGLALAAAGCGGGSGGGSGDPERKPRDSDAPSLGELRKKTVDTATKAQIESFAKIRIPASATGLRSLSRSLQNTQLLVSFRLPAGDVAEFLDSSDFTGSLTKGDLTVTTTVGSEIGWHLEDAKRLKGLSDTRAGLARNLVVVRDDPQQPMLYLEALTF